MSHVISNNYNTLNDPEFGETDSPKPFKFGYFSCVQDWFCCNFENSLLFRKIYNLAFWNPTAVYGKIMENLGTTSSFWRYCYMFNYLVLPVSALIIAGIALSGYDLEKPTDFMNFLLAFLLTLIPLAQIMLFYLNCDMRYQLRKAKNIEGNICYDAMASCITSLMFIQAAKELNIYSVTEEFQEAKC